MDWNWLKTEYPFEQSIQEKRNVVLSVSFFASLIVVVLQLVGIWENGKENGEGTLYYRNGKKISGNFNNGILEEISVSD